MSKRKMKAKAAGATIAQTDTPPVNPPAPLGVNIIRAKSILQAVLAAHNAGTLDDDNYDIHWPLTLVIELLEAANTQAGEVQS